MIPYCVLSRAGAMGGDNSLLPETHLKKMSRRPHSSELNSAVAFGSLDRI